MNKYICSGCLAVYLTDANPDGIECRMLNCERIALPAAPEAKIKWVRSALDNIETGERWW